MDTLSAFAMGAANRGKPLMVFDWNAAAEVIRDRRPAVAAAGLRGDWEWTGGVIYRDGRPVPRDETYTYLASTWAEPEIELDGERIPCWRWGTDVPEGWGDAPANAYWPPSAVAILGGAPAAVAGGV